MRLLRHFLSRRLSGALASWVVAATMAAVLAGSAAADYYEARAYFRQGKFQRALTALQPISPAPPELLLMKADCLVALERFQEAAEACRELLEKFPTSAFASKAMERQIDSLGRLRDYPALVKVLEQAVVQDPAPDSPFLKELALAYVKAGQTARAIAALEASPTSRNLGLLASILKESKQLVPYLAESERAFDGSLQKARILGMMFLAAQNWQKAKDYLSKAAPIEETLLALVEAARGLKDSAAQAALYEKLSALEPGKGVYYEKLGELYQQRGDNPKALATWALLVTKLGPTPESFGWLGRVLLAHGFKRESLQAYLEARVRNDDPGLFRKEVAECHVALGEPAEAAREYLELAPASSDDVKAPLLTLAGSSDVAFAAVSGQLQAALATSPRQPEYYFLADDVLRLKGYGPPAEKLVDDMCLAFQTLPRELLGYAEEFSGRGRLEEALRVAGCLVATAGGPELWDALFVQATLLRRAGRPTEALASLERLRASSPAADHVTRCDSLKGELLLEDLRQPAQARQVFEALAAAYPASPELPVWQLQAARAALGMLEFAAAHRLLDTVLRSSRADVKRAATYQLGKLALLEGKTEEATEAFASVPLEDTASPVANDALEELYFLTTHPVQPADAAYLKSYFLLSHYLSVGQMERYTTLAASLDPKGIPVVLAADFLVLQARAQRRQGKAAEAAHSLELLLEKYAGSALAPEAMLELGDLYEKELKDPGKAQKYLKDYVFARPASLELDALRERIQKLSTPKS